MGFWNRLFGSRAKEPRSSSGAVKIAGTSLAVHRSERFHFTMQSPADWEVTHRNQKQGEWTIAVAWAGPSTPIGRPGFLVNVRESEILNRNMNVRKTYVGPDG